MPPTTGGDAPAQPRGGSRPYSREISAKNSSYSGANAAARRSSSTSVASGPAPAFERIAAGEGRQAPLPAVAKIRIDRGHQLLSGRPALVSPHLPPPEQDTVLGEVGGVDETEPAPRRLPLEDTLCRPKEREA